MAAVFIGKEAEGTEVDLVVGGFGSDASGRRTLDGAVGFSTSASGAAGSDSANGKIQLEMARLLDRTINASIVLAAGSLAIAKLLTIDHNYWHALFPFDDWWVVPAKVAFDQTAWSALWNSIYFILLGGLAP